MPPSNILITPRLGLPVVIDAAGTASATFDANTARAISATPQDVASQLRITLTPNETVDLDPGFGWAAASPNAVPFGNAVTLTSLAGKFIINTVQ